MVSVGGGCLDIEFLLLLGQMSVVLPPGHCEADQDGPDVTDGSGEKGYGDEAGRHVLLVRGGGGGAVLLRHGGCPFGQGAAAQAVVLEPVSQSRSSAEKCASRGCNGVYGTRSAESG